MADIKQLASKLYLDTDLGPQNREINYKGRIRQVFKTFSNNMTQLMGVNMLMLLFCVPFVILFMFLMPAEINGEITKRMLNFSGGLGIGYGVVDQTNIGIEIIYNIRIKYFAIYFLPCIMLASIGFAGAYHCCRNYLWNTKTKVFKHFFRGVGRHWWKFLITFTYLGAVGTSTIVSIFMLLKANALQNVTSGGMAGLWIWVIASSVLMIASILYCLLALPTYVQYNFTFNQNLSNTLILLPIVIAPTLFITISLSAPLLLLMVSSIKYFVYIFFASMGMVLYILFNLAYGQYVNDNFVRAIHQAQEKQKQKELEQKNKKPKKTTNNNNNTKNKPNKKRK